LERCAVAPSFILLKVHKLAFAVDISFAKAKKDDSEIRIKNKEVLLHALIDKDTFDTETRYFNFGI
jgi:hypothetical protein